MSRQRDVLSQAVRTRWVAEDVGRKLVSIGDLQVPKTDMLVPGVAFVNRVQPQIDRSSFANRTSTWPR